MADKVEPLRLVMMGTGPFAVPSFEALRLAGHLIVAVFTRPIITGSGGRAAPASPVRVWATEHGLSIEDPESANSEEVVEQLRQFRADLLVVCDYGQILKRSTLGTARLGGINLHGSLLPAFRGAAPVQWAVWSGSVETGVSVIHMTPKLDGGPILSVRKTIIGDHETAGELEPRLADLGVDAVLDSIVQLATWDGISAIGVTQDESKSSKAPRLSKADGNIDWSKSARQLHCQVRALQPWPCAAFNCQPLGKPLVRIVLRAVTPMPTGESPVPLVPGTVISTSSEWKVATGDGMLRIDRVQPAGKREMTAAEFLRGNPLPSDYRLSGSQD